MIKNFTKYSLSLSYSPFRGLGGRYKQMENTEWSLSFGVFLNIIPKIDLLSLWQSQKWAIKYFLINFAIQNILNIKWKEFF